MIMEIYHLYHSGVAVDYQNNLIVFDYYNDETDELKVGLNNGVIRGELLRNYRKIYVFVSHNHSDHYNPVIFQWQDYNPGIKYILSDDIEIINNAKQENIHFMKIGDSFSIDNIKVFAYGSTDKGVSFLINVNGRTIFHSGDLNWWHWNSFSAAQLLQEESDFKEELNKLKGGKIDIAFLPVDPRLEEKYYLAGEYFIKTIKPSLFIPIHFADDYSISEKFANRIHKKVLEHDTEVAIIKKRGEKIIFK